MLRLRDGGWRYIVDVTRSRSQRHVSFVMIVGHGIEDEGLCGLASGLGDFVGAIRLG
ncbi:hypothetical protein [Bradyrhizobium sp. ORS 285]|uniref:hypothetical protein n=1 Tax=Bradyrhizobium sp. ORS 285 TaxID=115808 RepID=UPI00031B6463|nr:hypothetical protein [Bradyrhizobium sp. ORS 285]